MFSVEHVLFLHKSLRLDDCRVISSAVVQDNIVSTQIRPLQPIVCISPAHVELVLISCKNDLLWLCYQAISNPIQVRMKALALPHKQVSSFSYVLHLYGVCSHSRWCILDYQQRQSRLTRLRRAQAPCTWNHMRFHTKLSLHLNTGG